MLKKIFSMQNIDITDKQEKDFIDYREYIIEYNKIMDITNITEEEEMYIKHFLDSVLISKSKINLDGKSIIDIGTGGGFPGVPLKIMHPSISLTLMDSLNKRIRFLEDVTTRLNLDNTISIHARAEELARNKKYREAYDIATSRAVANLSTLVEYCLAFVKVGGYFIAMKGPNYQEELDSANNAINTMGGKIEEVIEYELPNNLGSRSLIIVKKIKSTPPKYPRGQGKPKNYPL